MIWQNFPASFSSFQSAVCTAIARLPSAEARSTLQDIRGLSHWGGDRPQSLKDLLDERRFFSVWLNPQMGAPLCALLQLDAREIYAREVRAERLLEGHRSLGLTLTERIHASPATQIVLAMRAYPEATLTLSREGEARPLAMTPSVLDWLVLELQKGEALVLRAQGLGNRELLEAIEASNRRGWIVERTAATSSAVRKIHASQPRDVAFELASIAHELGVETLSGIYHVVSESLYVGPSSLSHPSIGEAAGYTQDSFCRVCFEKTGDSVRAYFPEIYTGFQMESICGRGDLRRWLAPLFDPA